MTTARKADRKASAKGFGHGTGRSSGSGAKADPSRAGQKSNG